MLSHLFAVPALPQRVVVIGAGFVGMAIADAARVAGIDVLTLGQTDVDLMVPDAARNLAMRLRAGDSVVAAAARAPCRDAGMLIDNIIIAGAIIAAVNSLDVAHVVNISSDSVYGDDQLPLTEATPAAPGTLHGIMHLAREIMFRSQIKAPLAIVRPTLIYGAADPHNGYGPNRFRRLANADEDITLFGAGEERRDHVLIDDVARLAVLILLHGSVGTLNLATGEVYSFRDAADLVIAATGAASAVKFAPRKGPLPHNGYRPFDIAALRAAFPDFDYVKLPLGISYVQKQVGRYGRG